MPLKHKWLRRRVAFLFRGSQPFRIRLRDELGEIGQYELAPTIDPQAFERSIVNWWNAYADHAQQQIERGDYPPWVETYLVAMLSGRTGNVLPDWFVDSGEQDQPADLLWSTLEYLTGADNVAEETFRHTSAGLTSANQPQPSRSSVKATLPLPTGPAWQRSKIPQVDDSVAIEPIATRVPPECFYLRFGSFANYLWFVDLTEEYGGDVGRMITLRGTEDRATERFQNQIAVKINQLSRMLGPTVVEDQAVIGRDLFTANGSTMGVIIKAKNAFLLRSSLTSERSGRAKSDSAVTLKEVQVAGKKVSLLSTADHAVRSFLAERRRVLFDFQ